MRISDWSSDVCSSDLLFEQGIAPGEQDEIEVGMGEHLFADRDFVDADPDRAHRPGIAERAHRLVPAVQELAEMMGVRLAVGHPAEIVRIEYVDPVAAQARTARLIAAHRSEEHTSELQSL